MIKKNVRVLLAYILGVVASLFLTVPLSPLFGFSPKLFSTITIILTLAFVYTKMWKSGKYDALKKEVSVLRAFCYLCLFIVITFSIQLIAIIFNSTGNINIPALIGIVWLYPFTGFFTNETFLPATFVSAAIVIVISLIAYFMGIKGFSVSDKILNARKRRIDKKAEKHFEEIEKIKEQYRNKK